MIKHDFMKHLGLLALDSVPHSLFDKQLDIQFKLIEFYSYKNKF